MPGYKIMWGMAMVKGDKKTATHHGQRLGSIKKSIEGMAYYQVAMMAFCTQYIESLG